MCDFFGGSSITQRVRKVLAHDHHCWVSLFQDPAGRVFEEHSARGLPGAVASAAAFVGQQYEGGLRTPAAPLRGALHAAHPDTQIRVSLGSPDDVWS
jgi:hypothetical protein